MNVLAICGAANKNRNTATMLKSAFDGAMSAPDATGEMVFLYDLTFRGCIGCHTCKLLAQNRPPGCNMKDELTAVLAKALEADVLLIGSPIYFGDVTGQTRSFLERLLFPGVNYDQERTIAYQKRAKVGWVFTMNAPGELYKDYFAGLTALTDRIIGASEYVMAYHTKQFEDYSKYKSGMFDEEMIKKRHREQFPKDCQAASEMGKRLAGKI